MLISFSNPFSFKDIHVQIRSYVLSKSFLSYSLCNVITFPNSLAKTIKKSKHIRKGILCQFLFISYFFIHLSTDRRGVILVLFLQVLYSISFNLSIIFYFLRLCSSFMLLCCKNSYPPSFIRSYSSFLCLFSSNP